MNLRCPSCGSNHIGNDVLDWYGDAVFGKFHCDHCGCTFAAKYVLDGTVNGSIRISQVLPSRVNLGGQMVRHMISFAERSVH